MMLVQDINRHKSLVCNFASGGRKSSPSAPAAASFSSAAEVKHVTSPPVYWQKIYYRQKRKTREGGVVHSG